MSTQSRQYYEDGMRAKNAAQIDNAIELLSQAAGIDSNDLCTLIELGECHMLAGQRDAAESFYDKALVIEPNNALAMVLKAHVMLYRDAKDRDQAWKLCRKALQQPTQSDRILSEAAMVAMSESPEEATVLIDKALSIVPTSSKAIFASAVLEECINRNTAKASQLYAKAAALDPLVREQLYTRIAYMSKISLNKEALFLLKTFLSSDKDEARYSLIEGRIATQMGDLEKAAVSFSRAVCINPESIEGLIGLGQCLARQGDPVGAEKNYKAALRLDKYCAEALANLAAIYCDIHKKHDIALGFADRAVRADENLLTAWVNRGIILMHVRRYEESARSFDTALAIDPHHSLALLRKGALLIDHLALYDEAMRCFNAVLQFDPKNIEAWWGLSQVAMKKDDPKTAVEYIEKLLEIDPDHTEARWNHALLLRRIGREEEAQFALRSLAADEPSNPRASEALNSMHAFPHCPIPLDVVMLLRNMASASEQARSHLEIISTHEDPIYSTVFVGLLYKSLSNASQSRDCTNDILSILKKVETGDLVQWLSKGGARQILNTL